MIDFLYNFSYDELMELEETLILIMEDVKKIGLDFEIIQN